MSERHKRTYNQTVADPRGAIWGNCPSKGLWHAVEWRPLKTNAALFESIEVETEINRATKCCTHNKQNILMANRDPP